MPEINLDADYFENLKTKRLILRLGNCAEVIPIKIWLFAAKNSSRTGLFKGVSDEELVAFCGIAHPRQPKEIVDALVEFGFLERTNEGIRIHDWEDYQGHLHAYKMRAKNAAKARWDKLKKKA